MAMPVNKQKHMVVFGNQVIRRTLHNGEWYFSIIDVVSVLTNSLNTRDYWYKMKARMGDEESAQLSTICRQLKLEAPDGKKRETDCANTEGLFRVIQSIPSPKAEPFKRWLAKVGYERVQEIEDPELGLKRTRALYKAKGYPDNWIEKRIRGIQVREELTGEWKNRRVDNEKEMAILTSEISKATFGLTPGEYKKLKGLKRENLRDHMTNLELIFTMLGEASTTEITREKDAQGFIENHQAARAGGEVAGNARKDLETKLKKKVTTEKNFLSQAKKLNSVKL